MSTQAGFNSLFDTLPNLRAHVALHFTHSISGPALPLISLTSVYTTAVKRIHVIASGKIRSSGTASGLIHKPVISRAGLVVFR